MINSPYRTSYVFPTKPKPKNLFKTDVKNLFIGLGIQIFVYSLVFGYLVYIKESKYFAMGAASLISMIAPNLYWIKNVFNEPTDYKTNSTDNKLFNSGYRQHGFVTIKQSL
jgi:hypothetical protein